MTVIEASPWHRDIETGLAAIQNRNGDLPDQAARIIRDAITTHQVPPGQRLPSERQLSEATGVSRETISRAFHQLRNIGMIDSRVPIGWITRRIRPVLRIGGDRYQAEAHRIGNGDREPVHHYVAELGAGIDAYRTEQQSTARPARLDEAERFKIRGDGEVYERVIVEYVDDEPARLRTSVMPAEVIDDGAFEKGTAYGALEELYLQIGIKVVRVDDEYTTHVIPTDAERHALALGGSETVTRCIRTYHSQYRPIMSDTILYPGPVQIAGTETWPVEAWDGDVL